MILHPAVLALVVSSLLQSAMLLFASWNGALILRGWSPGSGSERQLALERRNCLVSSVVGYALAFQLLSLFFFLFTADRLHIQLTGAMCAAGTLNANGYGYPALLLKTADFLLAGTWLVVNHADTRGYDAPLVKTKCRLLLLLAPLLFLDAFLQFRFFADLEPDVITSCCGSLFGSGKGGLASDLASWPAVPAMGLFFAVLGATVAMGVVFLRSARGAVLFALLCGVTFPAAILALVSAFSLYIYDLPTHHCPFCVLQAEYGHIGYLLYAALLGGAAAGLSAGALAAFRKRGSMAAVVPPLQRRLVWTAIAFFLLFALAVSFRIVVSPYRSG